MKNGEVSDFKTTSDFVISIYSIFLLWLGYYIIIFFFGMERTSDVLSQEIFGAGIPLRIGVEPWFKCLGAMIKLPLS